MSIQLRVGGWYKDARGFRTKTPMAMSSHPDYEFVALIEGGCRWWHSNGECIIGAGLGYDLVAECPAPDAEPEDDEIITGPGWYESRSGERFRVADVYGGVAYGHRSYFDHQGNLCTYRMTWNIDGADRRNREDHSTDLIGPWDESRVIPEQPNDDAAVWLEFAKIGLNFPADKLPKYTKLAIFADELATEMLEKFRKRFPR